MKVHSNFTGQKSTKRLLAFSCATALASFAFIARPAFAEEAKADNASNLDVTAATTTNVETTADLVETKVVEAPATTENVASTESTTNVSDQATTAAASSETASETASTTASESQTPAESATGQTREAVTTDRAAGETATPTADTNSETNVTGGQYYSDSLGNWYYKDASGKNLTGDQTIDGVKVSFREDGKQIKGPDLNGDSNLHRYFDDHSGQLQTNRYLEYKGNWYYLGENGRPLTGAHTINGQKVFFRENGQQVKGAYGDSFGDLYGFYDVDSGDLLTNRYVEYMGNWFYVGKDGKPVKGSQNIDGQDVFFNFRGVQAKGDFGRDGVYMPEYYYDKDNGRKVTKAGFVKDNRGLTYYLDEKGEKVLGLHEINGDLYYFRQGGAYKYTQLGDMWQDSINYIDGKIYYFDQFGKAAKNRFVFTEGAWHYFYGDGTAATGAVQINGQKLYFDTNHGRQVKGAFAPDGHYYDENSGELVTNQTRTIKGVTYHFDENGNATKV